MILDFDTANHAARAVLRALRRTTNRTLCAIVYVVVQQLEGSVMMPLAQRWAVELPPALGLVAVVSLTLLVGFPGILFGSPLAVVVMILVQPLYLKHGLEARRPSRANTS